MYAKQAAVKKEKTTRHHVVKGYVLMGLVTDAARRYQLIYLGISYSSNKHHRPEVGLNNNILRKILESVDS